MRIYLIRHGETDWNKQKRIQGREDIELNDNGITQAQKCGYVLQGLPIDIIVSSPLKRAKETAEIIALSVGINDVMIEDNLIERDYGKLSGLDPGERELFSNSGQDDGVENWDDLNQRVMNVLKYYSGNIYQNIVMVSHGGAINAVLATLSGHNIGSGKTKLKNACINLINCMDQTMEIEFYNLTSDEMGKHFNK